MKSKIEDFAQIIPGYTFRGAIQTTKNGNTYVLQAKNVKPNVSINNIQDLIQVQFPTIRSSAFLKKHDVVLLSRGMGAGTFRCTVFVANGSNIIASSSVHIIRINSPYILPEYLSLYLNSKNGQQEIDQIATGSHLQIISRFDLAGLEIPIPTIEQQQLLVKLENNMKEQEKLTTKKYELYDNLMNATIKNFLSV